MTTFQVVAWTSVALASGLVGFLVGSIRERDSSRFARHFVAAGGDRG